MKNKKIITVTGFETATFGSLNINPHHLPITVFHAWSSLHHTTWNHLVTEDNLQEEQNTTPVGQPSARRGEMICSINIFKVPTRCCGNFLLIPESKSICLYIYIIGNDLYICSGNRISCRACWIG